MLGAPSNPLLAKTEQTIQSKVPPQLLPMVQRIVMAGHKVLYDPQTHAMAMKALTMPGDKATVAGQAATKLVGLLYTEAHGGITVQAVIPAGVMLLCEALDFMEQAGMLKVTQQVLADAMKSMTTSTLQMFNITPQKLVQMKASRQAGGQQGAPQGGQPPTQPAQSAPPTGIIAGAQGAM